MAWIGIDPRPTKLASVNDFGHYSYHRTNNKVNAVTRNNIIVYALSLMYVVCIKNEITFAYMISALWNRSIIGLVNPEDNYKTRLLQR